MPKSVKKEKDIVVVPFDSLITGNCTIMIKYWTKTVLLGLTIGLFSCGDDNELSSTDSSTLITISENFGSQVPTSPAYGYQEQSIPAYISKDNTRANPISDEGATLGRVLFYDKALSVDQSVACSSCHQQNSGFGDRDVLSQGINGLTGRHSMRLINSRFSDESQFFWDERAKTLEEQTTQPIQDHAEMGFSGQDGDPDLNDLIDRLAALDYYQSLFTWTYGDPTITEDRIQQSIAQFIRSIQSFDSKYDQGLSEVNDQRDPFTNFSELENRGKQLFMDPPNRGGAGCDGCHRAPEFDIDPNSQSNGVVTVAGSPNAIDNSNTRSPSLRGLFNSDGQINGPLMHDGSFATLEAVVAHYNNIPDGIDGIDNRLRNQNLNLNDEDMSAIVAFLKTLTGEDVYTNPMWSDPFTN
jgi:cytochrome c peroxidase